MFDIVKADPQFNIQTLSVIQYTDIGGITAQNNST